VTATLDFVGATVLVVWAILATVKAVALGEENADLRRELDDSRKQLTGLKTLTIPRAPKHRRCAGCGRWTTKGRWCSDVCHAAEDGEHQPA